MEQTNTPLDQVTGASASRPQFLTVLCILSYIGGALWTLLSLIGIFAANWIMSLFGMAVEQGLSDTNSGLTDEQREQIGQASDMMGGLGAGIIIVVFVIFLILSVLSLLGTHKMYNLKKSGFTLYIIANGLLFLLMLLSFNIVMILVLGAFIAMYAVNRKALVY